MSIQSVAAERKRASRRAIVRSASRHLRRHGPARASLKAITADAGLTVGGLYNHFGSKAELLASGFRQGALERRGLIARALRGKRGFERLAAWLATYLTAKHRDNVIDGCLIAATLGDVSRGQVELQDVVAEEIEVSLDAIARWIAPQDPQTEFATAVRTMAMAIGTLQLARATARKPELSDAILAAGKQGVPQ